MAESGENYSPGPWAGYDYTKARNKHVDVTANRGYALASALNSMPDKTNPKASVTHKSKTGGLLVPEKLITDVKSPLVIITDGTGSMGEFPKVIFEKLPLLDDGVKDYLEDCSVSLAMIGDAYCDKFPLQVQPFARGKDMVDCLNNLSIEGGGGGNQEESYELAALYYARNIEMPKATKPILIFICDEGLYSHVNKDWAEKFANVKLDKDVTTASVFKELTKKFSVYVIRKHFESGVWLDGDNLVGLNKTIHEKWQKLVGDNKVAILSDPRRVVDVILGLLAADTGKIDFFTKEITVRQKSEQVKTVMKAMTSISKVDPAKATADPNLSVTKKPKDGGSTKATGSLL